MTAQVREAMAAGAVGFATSTAEAHNGEGGTPMPSRLADDRELRTLVRTMGESGRGVYMLTKGSKTSIPYLEELAVEAKRPVVIAALFHSNTNPTAAFTTLDQINAARSRGHQLVAQTSCCPLSMDFTFKSPYLFESMQSWKPAMAAHDGDALKKVYRDTSWRDAVRKELEASRGRLVFNGEWDKLFVVETAKAENRASRRSDAGGARQEGEQGPARLHPRLRAVGEPRHHVRGPAPAQRREGGGPHPGRSQHPHLAVGCRRASHLLLRCRLRPAPDGPLEPRSRRARPAAGGASADRPAGRGCSACKAAACCARAMPPT